MPNLPLLRNNPTPNTNCYPASTNVVCGDPTPGPQFLSVTETNQCVAGAMILATATYTNIPGSNTITITYSNADLCPPLVTNYPVSAVILTNWWDAGFTNRSGLTASFSPPDCTGGTIYFYITYSNAPPCTNGTVGTSIGWSCDCDCTHHLSGVDQPAGVGMVCRPTDNWTCCATNSLCGSSFSLSCDGSVHLNGPAGECGHCPYPHSIWSASYAFCQCKAVIMKTQFSVLDNYPGDATFGHWKIQTWACATQCVSQCYQVLTWYTNSEGIMLPLTTTNVACSSVDQ